MASSTHFRTGHATLALIVALVPGCKLVERAANVPGQVASGLLGEKKKSSDRSSPNDVQAALMRFADTFAARMSSAIEEFSLAAKTPEAHRRALTWAAEANSAVFTIASGKNSTVDLLDMLAFVSLGRMAHAEHWTPDVYGAADQPMLDAFEKSEVEVWGIAQQVLSEKQQNEFRAALTEWREANPDVSATASIRLPDVKDILGSRKESKSAGSDDLGDLLSLDPFSGLEPATREIERTRMFAERALFYVQRMPQIMSTHVELLGLKLGSGALEDLERVQEPAHAILTDAHSTLEAGTQMSNSLAEAIRTLDAFVARVSPDVKREATESTEPFAHAKHFDVEAYGRAASNIDTAARDVDALLTNLDQRMPQLQRALDEAAVRGDRLVDRAFWRVLVAGGILIVATAIAALGVRWISARWIRRSTREAPERGPRPQHKIRALNGAPPHG